MSEAKSGGALVLVLVAASVLTGGVLAQDAGSSTSSSIVDGVFAATQASSGQQQFQRACASCHAVSEHAGRTFAARWAGSTLGDLFELVRDTMPEGDPGSLELEEYTGILAFFLKESGYKGGEKECAARDMRVFSPSWSQDLFLPPSEGRGLSSGRITGAIRPARSTRR